jgi:hypothetical protein
VVGSESLQTALVRAMHEATKVKPKLQWIVQDIRDAWNVEHQLKKTVGNK